MNFIIKLLKSKNLITEILYDLIMVIINKLTRNVHFILFKKTFNTK